MGRLTDLDVHALTRPGRYGDGNTLYLVVAPRGSKSWIQRIGIRGRRHDLGLGPFPKVCVAEARERAIANRVAVRNGRDIAAEKKRARSVPTLEEAARRVHELFRPSWTNEAHARGWIQTLQRHAFSTLAPKRVDEITRPDVLAVLEPIWTTRPETARRVRQRIRTILDWCEAYDYVTENPAGDCINAALPSMQKSQRHYLAMPYAEVGQALQIVDSSRVTPIVKQCLRFVVLTAVRGADAREARWKEIDLTKRQWCIPATRMKARREHRVPLSTGALAVLKEAGRLKRQSRAGLVFGSSRKPGNPLSNMALLKALRDTGLADKTTVHGFRSSFRDCCAEHGKSRSLANAALAHVVSGVEGAYFRSDLFEARRELMQEWADYIVVTGKKSVV